MSHSEVRCLIRPEKIFQDTGVRYTLDHVERAMYVEGFLEAKDVYKPNTKRKEYGY